MRSVVFLLLFLCVASFGDLRVDFNSKTRNFSVELLYHTLQDSDQNVAISPYVTWYLLMSMAYETMGVTWEQVSKVLLLTERRSKVVEEFKKLNSSVLVTEDVDIKLFNFLFYDEHLNVYSDSIRRLEDDFCFITRRFDYGHPQSAADSALETFRSHRVSSLRIRTKDLENPTKIIMCNSLLFHAQWSIPFSYTERDYYQNGNETSKRSMIYTKARIRFSDFETLHASVTELPYGGDGKYCMLLIRPHRGYDIKQVYRNLRNVSLNDIFAKLQSDVDEFGLKEVEVELPSLAISSYVSLIKPLSNMGISDVFDRNLANFSNFAEDNTYIGEFAHWVLVFITKSETIVHTTTPSYGSTLMPIKQIPEENPFIFFIMEKSTATVLFGGSYSKFESIDVDRIRTEAKTPNQSPIKKPTNNQPIEKQSP